MKHDVKPRIVHVLDDGTRLDSIEGFVIPDGHPFYTVWRNIVLAKRKEKNEKDKGFIGCGSE